MTRAHGKKNPPRGTDPGPGTPGGLDIGESIRQEPDGWINTQTGNIVNEETKRQAVLTIPYTRDEYTGWMAHGVPNESDTTEGHAFSERGGRSRQIGTNVPVKPVVRPTPVPVYITQLESGPVSFINSSPRHITVPNNASDPVRIAGWNPKRARIGLLNEDTATNVRFANRISDLTNGGGALLPYPINSYSWFETQGELFAVTTSATLTVLLSIIEEFEQEL